MSGHNPIVGMAQEVGKYMIDKQVTGNPGHDAMVGACTVGSISTGVLVIASAPVTLPLAIGAAVIGAMYGLYKGQKKLEDDSSN